MLVGWLVRTAFSKRGIHNVVTGGNAIPHIRAAERQQEGEKGRGNFEPTSKKKKMTVLL